MDYVLSSGNFGNRRENERSYSENVIIHARNPVAAIKYMQKSGLKKWRAAQRFPVLRPFAWIYQGGRYIRKGLSQKDAWHTLKSSYSESKRRRGMFDALGVRQDSKGLIVYKNGKYVKE